MSHVCECVDVALMRPQHPFMINFQTPASKKKARIMRLNKLSSHVAVPSATARGAASTATSMVSVQPDNPERAP